MMIKKATPPAVDQDEKRSDASSEMSSHATPRSSPEFPSKDDGSSTDDEAEEDQRRQDKGGADKDNNGLKTSSEHDAQEDETPPIPLWIEFEVTATPEEEDEGKGVRGEGTFYMLRRTSEPKHATNESWDLLTSNDLTTSASGPAGPSSTESSAAQPNQTTQRRSSLVRSNHLGSANCQFSQPLTLSSQPFARPRLNQSPIQHIQPSHHLSPVKRSLSQALLDKLSQIPPESLAQSRSSVPTVSPTETSLSTSPTTATFHSKINKINGITTNKSAIQKRRHVGSQLRQDSNPDPKDSSNLRYSLSSTTRFLRGGSAAKTASIGKNMLRDVGGFGVEDEDDDSLGNFY